MANYYAACRTNYFKVKDNDAFEKAMANIPGIDVCDGGDKGFCLLGDDPDGAGWPAWLYDEENGDDIELDIGQVVAEHLPDGEVAIFMESGAEKLRYVVGYAFAVNNKGEVASVALNDIYELASELTDRPDDVTVCEY